MVSSESDEPAEEYSKGGSRIHRYEGGEFDKPTLGFTEESTAEFMAQREAVYADLFGENESVSHEVLPLVPHIDIYVYPPTAEREFYTLVTGGMSDLRMTLPEGIPMEYARVELILYCTEPKPEYLEWLRVLAHFPHDNRTWLGPEHTMPNGNPPLPMFDNNQDLTSFLMISSIIRPDNLLADRLILDGDPVNFLWLVPISTAECDYKLENGMNAFYDILQENQHPVVLDESRKSYV